jgi:Tol biopolymer transport system component
MAADGAAVVQLTFNANGDGAPSWSPAGDRLVFNGNRAEQTLYVRQTDGATLPIVPRSVRPGGPAWGQDNMAAEGILFTGYRPGSGHSEILRVAPDGSGLVLLTFNEVSFDYAAGWLPAPH